LNDYFATYGPDAPRQNLSVSTMVDLRGGFQLSFVSAFQSHQPVAPTFAGVDNSGTNYSTAGYTPLLGIMGKGYSGFLSKSELSDLVSQYNSKYAGTLTPAGAAGVVAGQRYPAITLPADYQLGDFFSSQDLRLTKSFNLPSRTELRLIGEVFNMF